MLGLRIPADDTEPVLLMRVELSAAALSDAIGGGLLGEQHGHAGGVGFTVYLDDDRAAKSLPGNARAAALATRLGEVDRQWLAGLRGDALVLGRDQRFDDADVPTAVVRAALRAGLLDNDEQVDR